MKVFRIKGKVFRLKPSKQRDRVDKNYNFIEVKPKINLNKHEIMERKYNIRNVRMTEEKKEEKTEEEKLEKIRELIENL